MELLVVLAVISVLAALILPALSRGRDRAASVLCESNLRQWGLDLQMYVDDHHVYPPFSMTDTTIENLKQWYERLGGYAGSGRGKERSGLDTLSCSAYAKFALRFERPLGSGGYGYNRSGIGTWGGRDQFGLGGDSLPGKRPTLPENLRLIRSDEVKFPTEMISLGDAIIGSWWSPSSGEITEAQIELNPTQSDSIWAELGLPHRSRSRVSEDLELMRARHGGRWNVLFCDGHVERRGMASLFDVRKDSVLRMWNRDHQSHTEALPALPR